MEENKSDTPDNGENNIIKEGTPEKRPKSGFIQRFGYFLKGIKPMALSHHPVCGQFDDHVFKLKNMELCFGCFIGFPTAFITLVILFILRGIMTINPNFLWTVGFYLCCSYLLSVFKITKYRIIKILSKILIGIGTGFITTAVLFSTGPLWFRILIILFFFQITTAIVNVKRSYDIHKTCKRCEFKEDWDQCVGMKESMEFFRKSGFLSKKTPKRAE